MRLIIETERLILTPITREILLAAIQDDRERISGLLGAAVPHDWPSEDVASSLHDLAVEWETLSHFVSWIWLIVRRTDPTVIGDIGFHWPIRPDREIGYGVLPAYQGQGYATEAVRGLIHWTIQNLAVVRLSAECLASNAASIRVLEKAGFHRTREANGLQRWVLRREDYIHGYNSNIVPRGT